MTFEQFVCWAMSAVCSGGGVYGYMQKRSLPSLIAGLGFGALYGISARLVQSGRALDGVDLSIRTIILYYYILLVASTLMLMAMGPRAYATRANVPIVLTSASAIILARMGYVSYGLRHGRPL